MDAQIPRLHEFYTGQNILIIGTTTFTRDVLIEKIIRQLPQVNKIYLPVQNSTKSPFHSQQLFEDLSKSKIFGRNMKKMKGYKQYLKEKVKCFDINYYEDGLGLSQEQKQDLIDNIDLVICFMDLNSPQAPLKEMIEVNIYGPHTLLQLAKQFKYLKNFIHISRIGALYGLPTAEEKFYEFEVGVEGYVERIYDLSQSVSKDKQNMLKEYPNNYVYTKRACELLLKKAAGEGFPLTILRPGFIGAALEEPFSGWIESKRGMEILYRLIGLSQIDVVLAKNENKYMEVPVDIVANIILVAGCKLAKSKEPQIINMQGCGKSNTFGQINQIVTNYWNQYALEMREGPIKIEVIQDEGNFLKRIDKKTEEVIQWKEKAAKFSNFDVMRRADKILKEINRTKRIAERLKFVFYDQWPEIQNDKLEVLKQLCDEKELKDFNIDLKSVDYAKYTKVACWGVSKFLLRDISCKKIPYDKVSMKPRL